MAVRERASLYMVLLAAFASALGKYSGREEVVIGSPVSRRSQPGTEQMIGQFMNTVPLRIEARRDASLPALVRHVKEVLISSLAHQDAPFHLVTARLAAEHGPAAAGVAEVAFVIDEPEPGELVFGDLALAHVESGPVTARRELTLAVVPTDNEIAGTLTYDCDLFNAETIERIVRDFKESLTPAVV
jgi:non-ribosomal peptide synthetase component F